MRRISIVKTHCSRPLAGLATALLLAGCGTSATPTAAPPTAVAVPPTPAPTQAPPKPTVAAPTAAPPTTPTAAPPASPAMTNTRPADPFAVSVAQFYLDSAGFHDMATAISNTKKIDTAFLSKVNRVAKILSQTNWPASLSGQGKTFSASLKDFSAALEKSDIAAATKTSGTVHDAQHDLSHEIDTWMTSGPAKAKAADPFSVSVAQFLLDTAGFHDMATTLSNTQKIDTSYLSKVNRVRKVLKQATWPAALNDQAVAFGKSLDAFAVALEANKVKEAISASDAVHDGQHDLSHETDAWLAGNPAKAAAADLFNVSVAQYVLDTAGFHDMATSISNTQKINTSYASVVIRTRKVLGQLTWTPALKQPGEAFVAALAKFQTALEANTLKDALTASEAVHDAQHDLSHEIDLALQTGAAMPAMPGMPAMPAGPVAAAGPLSAEGVWIRRSGTGQNTAAYMLLKNSGPEDILLSASTDVAKMVEIHETVAAASGMMEMRPLALGLKVPANGSVELKPGSYHVMIMELKQDLSVGTSVKIRLTFKSGKTLDLTAPVQEGPAMKMP